MNKRTILSLGLTALIMVASLADVAVSGDAARGGAADHARKAGKALNKHQVAVAIGEAEAAVAAEARVADYRALLGRSYLQAGRFQSARQAFADALSLQPNDGAVALNLALTQVATGDWQGARATLEEQGDRIALADRGLATALAGDPASGVAMLNDAARAPGAGATVRQNLALALALSGQWSMARAVAAADLSPADVDARMQDWAAFAQPVAASDQVATLLGVRAVADAGQPAALALNAPVQPAVAVAELVAPTPAPAPAPAPEPVTRVVAVVPAAEPLPTPLLASVTFGPRREVVQPLPASPTVLIPAATTPAKVSFAAVLRARAKQTPAAAFGRGDWFVQIGAFGDADVARDAWGRISRRFVAFTTHVPQGTRFTSSGGSSFYRLSVGGFARGDAVAFCGKYRARGGACFVRRGAGDAIAAWVRKPGVQLASR